MTAIRSAAQRNHASSRPRAAAAGRCTSGGRRVGTITPIRRPGCVAELADVAQQRHDQLAIRRRHENEPGRARGARRARALPPTRSSTGEDPRYRARRRGPAPRHLGRKRTPRRSAMRVQGVEASHRDHDERRLDAAQIERPARHGPQRASPRGGAHAQKRTEQRRDHEQVSHAPSAKLRNRDHGERDKRRQRAEPFRTEESTVPGPRRARQYTDHAELRERERAERTDREQRDQAVGDAVERRSAARPTGTPAAGCRSSRPARGRDARTRRQELPTRQHAAHARKIGEAGVGRQREHGEHAPTS